MLGWFSFHQFADRSSGASLILLAIGWYLRFSLPYGDVEELVAERGVHADHVTVWRWIQRPAACVPHLS